MLNKSMLKNGMIVMLNNHNYYLVSNNTLKNYEGYIPINTYSDTLQSCYANHLDIKQIFSEKSPVTFGDFDNPKELVKKLYLLFE